MSFTSERQVKATRQQYLCDACQKTIPIGSSAARWSGMSDGEFLALVYHRDCREAEIKLNELRGYFPDGWIGLFDIEKEEWPWLLADFPAVAERLGITGGTDTHGDQ